MSILKKFRCKDCEFEFTDLPPGSLEEVDIGKGTKKTVPQECPDCGGSSIEPIEK